MAEMRNPLTGQPMTAIGLAAHERATLDAMQRLGIVKAVVFDNGEDYNGVLQWKKDAPDRVIAGMTITDPAKVDVTFLRNEFKAGRLQMIGEVAQQYLGIAPNDSRMEPIFALAEELDLPIGLHMFPPGTGLLPGLPFQGCSRRPSSARRCLGPPSQVANIRDACRMAFPGSHARAHVCVPQRVRGFGCHLLGPAACRVLPLFGGFRSGRVFQTDHVWFRLFGIS